MTDLDLFASVPETPPAPLLRPAPQSTLPRARATREEILARYEIERTTVVQALRNAAWLVYERERRPVSVLDVRATLDGLGYQGDPRIIASAFPRRDWEPMGFIPNPHAHARLIRTFIPRLA
jgi:hypothetical protein